MPIARFSPIWRGSRCKPPASAARPTRGSGSAKVAFSEAMMRSQASAISKPPPIATPLTAAMIGLSQSKRVVRPAKPPLSQPRLPPAACHFRSLPAQNALSPAPVTIATHCSGSAAEIVEHLVELEMRVDMQRVVHLGARQRHDRDRALARHFGKFQVHVCSRRFFLWRGISPHAVAVPMPSNYATAAALTSHIRLLDLVCGCHLNRRAADAASQQQ